jgi:hypothetical protein
MPAMQATCGPIEHFVVFPGQSIATYLGSAVLAPEQEAEDFKIPVLNDLGGRSVPFQLVQDGEQWMVMTTLNRFDLAVCRAIRALPGGGAPLGSETGIARGTLVIGLSDFQLILVNSYAGTPSAGVNAAALNAGRGFYSSTLLKYKESTVGTRVLEVSLAIQCNNVFNPATRGFSLYTESGLPALGPVS